MELRFPTLEHKQAALDFKKEHFNRGKTLIHGGGGLDTAESLKLGWTKSSATWMAALAESPQRFILLLSAVKSLVLFRFVTL